MTSGDCVEALRPILVCFDGTLAAARAIDAAATLFPGRRAVVLGVPRGRGGPAADAQDGVRLARRAGLRATPLTTDASLGIAHAVLRAAVRESVAAVVVPAPRRPLRTDRLLPGTWRHVVHACPVPVVVA